MITENFYYEFNIFSEINIEQLIVENCCLSENAEENKTSPMAIKKLILKSMLTLTKAIDVKRRSDTNKVLLPDIITMTVLILTLSILLVDILF